MNTTFSDDKDIMNGLNNKKLKQTEFIHSDQKNNNLDFNFKDMIKNHFKMMYFINDEKLINPHFYVFMQLNAMKIKHI
jgi:hypothetical protein